MDGMQEPGMEKEMVHETRQGPGLRGFVCVCVIQLT